MQVAKPHRNGPAMNIGVILTGEAYLRGPARLYKIFQTAPRTSRPPKHGGSGNPRGGDSQPIDLT